MGRETKGNQAALRERYRELIAENIAYDALLTDHPYEQDTLEEILELLVDVVCTTKLRPHFRRTISPPRWSGASF